MKTQGLQISDRQIRREIELLRNPEYVPEAWFEDQEPSDPRRCRRSKARRQMLKRLWHQANRDRNLARMKARYHAKREDVRKQQREYYESNRDEIRIQQKLYRTENRDDIARQKRQHYDENRDRIAEYNREYYAENRDAINAARRARRNGANEG